MDKLKGHWDHSTKPSKFCVKRGGKEIYRGGYSDGYELIMSNNTSETNDLARGNHVVPTEWAEQLERERDEARDDLEFRRELYRVQENYLELARRERDEARNERDVLRLDAQREAEHHDRMVTELEGLYDKNDKLRDITERALQALHEADLNKLPYFRVELDQLKEGRK
jgi:hypothetical protein